MFCCNNNNQKRYVSFNFATTNDGCGTLKGFKYELKDSCDCVIATAVTNCEGYAGFAGIVCGDYTLSQVCVPNCYELNTNTAQVNVDKCSVVTVDQKPICDFTVAAIKTYVPVPTEVTYENGVISGAGVSGATITITRSNGLGSELVGTTTVEPDGRWLLASTLPDGVIYVTQTVDGKTSASLPVTIPQLLV